MVAGIEARRHRALLVGGTGLYFQALVDGLEPPGRYPAVKRELEMEEDTPSLYRRLTELDPMAASRMEPSNRRRVIRALEVTLGSGRPFSSYGPGMTRFPCSVWRHRRRVAAPARGLGPDRGSAERRWSGRGWWRRSRSCWPARAGCPAPPARPSVIARSSRMSRLGTPLGAAVAEAERRTRAFARRQRVWWRRDPRIRWYGAADNPFAVMAQLLGDWKLT